MATILSAPEAADWTVPHTQFKPTPDGFTVSFNKTPEGLYRTMQSVTKATHGASGLSAAIIGLMGLAVIAVCLTIRLVLLAFPTVITVDSEHIAIGRKQLLRRDFGSFTVSHTIQEAEKNLGVLGYSYGNRSFAFGGIWIEKQATEVANALNKHLRLTPTGNGPSPDKLRTARPTEF